MTDDGEAGKDRRFEALKQQPVTDDVLDVVGHHGKHGDREVDPKIAVAKRGERYSLAPDVARSGYAYPRAARRIVEGVRRRVAFDVRVVRIQE